MKFWTLFVFLLITVIAVFTNYVKADDNTDTVYDTAYTSVAETPQSDEVEETQVEYDDHGGFLPFLGR